MKNIFFLAFIFSFSVQSAEFIKCELVSSGKTVSKEILVALPNETPVEAALILKKAEAKIRASYVLGQDHVSLMADFKTKRKMVSKNHKMTKSFPFEVKQEGSVLSCSFNNIFDDVISRNARVFKIAGSNPNLLIETETLLYFAAKNKNERLVSYLMSLGANPLFPNISGNTPLMAAASFENLKVLKTILDFDKKTINQRNRNGWNALMFAAKNNNLLSLNFLLENGSPIDEQDRSGRTALMIASKYGYFSIVDKLVQSGANLDLKRNNGMTAFMLAHKYGHSDILSLLQKNGASTFIAAESGPDFDWDIENEDSYYRD